MEEFQVARGTARQALAKLEEQGLIETVAGRGRFVRGVALHVKGQADTRYEKMAETLRTAFERGS